jgi:hypothetical protein
MKNKCPINQSESKMEDIIIFRAVHKPNMTLALAHAHQI